MDSEVHSSKGARPRKRKGGGGYGFFNTLNNSKNVHKNKVYRQPKKRSGDTRQFSRWHARVLLLLQGCLWVIHFVSSLTSALKSVTWHELQFTSKLKFTVSSDVLAGVFLFLSSEPVLSPITSSSRCLGNVPSVTALFWGHKKFTFCLVDWLCWLQILWSSSFPPHIWWYRTSKFTMTISLHVPANLLSVNCSVAWYCLLWATERIINLLKMKRICVI